LKNNYCVGRYKKPRLIHQVVVKTLRSSTVQDSLGDVASTERGKTVPSEPFGDDLLPETPHILAAGDIAQHQRQI
jgi:hypothetical protein